MMTSTPLIVNASAPRVAPLTKPRRPISAIVVSSRSELDLFVFCEGLRRTLRHYWAAPVLSQGIRQRRRRPRSALLDFQGSGCYNFRRDEPWPNALKQRSRTPPPPISVGSRRSITSP